MAGNKASSWISPLSYHLSSLTSDNNIYTCMYSFFSSYNFGGLWKVPNIKLRSFFVLSVNFTPFGGVHESY